MTFRVIQMLRRVMPPDRLATVSVSEGEALLFAYRHGYVHPHLVAAMNQLGQQIVDSDLFTLAPEGLYVPQYSISFERTSKVRGRMHCHVAEDPMFEIACRSDLIDAAVIRELNETVMPQTTRLIELSL